MDNATLLRTGKDPKREQSFLLYRSFISLKFKILSFLSLNLIINDNN